MDASVSCVVLCPVHVKKTVLGPQPIVQCFLPVVVLATLLITLRRMVIHCSHLICFICFHQRTVEPCCLEQGHYILHHFIRTAAPKPEIHACKVEGLQP